MPPTVVVTDVAWPTLDEERAVLAPLGADLVLARTGAEDELIELVADADAILTCWKKVTAAVLEAAPRCRMVSRYGIGLDNIDVGAATDLGMIVSNVPDFCLDEVADHTMAFVLAHSRHLLAFAAQTAGGGWDNKATGDLRRLRGQTIGLVGFGNIAQQVAVRAQAFGLHVLAWSRRLAAGEPPAVLGVEAVTTLDELLGRADVVSLHVPMSPATAHLIDASALAAMKPGSYLVNTSRGGLVDVEALADAVRRGHLSGAGLDVMPDEPAPADHPLRTLPGITMTPHAAFDSVEATVEVQTKAAANVRTVLEGGVPATIVNPEVLERPTLRLTT